MTLFVRKGLNKLVLDMCMLVRSRSKERHTNKWVSSLFYFRSSFNRNRSKPKPILLKQPQKQVKKVSSPSFQRNSQQVIMPGSKKAHPLKRFCVCSNKVSCSSQTVGYWNQVFWVPNPEGFLDNYLWALQFCGVMSSEDLYIYEYTKNVILVKIVINSR